MKKISLTQGKFAIVDDVDYESLSQFKWYARECGKGKFYAARKKTINGKEHTLYMHRFIMQALPNFEIDHIDGNGLDNRRKNLRVCQRQQNKHNVSKRSRLTSSKYKGVCWNRNLKKWQVYIKHNQKITHLGYYNNEEMAAKQYDQKAKQLFGDFAKTNF